MPVELKMNWKDISKVPLKNEVFLRKDEIRAAIMKRCHRKDRNRKLILNSRKLLVAACVISFIMSITYVVSNVKIRTLAISENVSLPDGSTVLLNQNSEVRYNRIAWLFRRTIYLNGGAQFAVTKGTPFGVETSMARVEVLGTVFDVAESEPDNLYVFCKEGSVRVVNSTVDQILSEGDAIELTGDKSLFKPKPDELYEFESIKLSDLAEKLVIYFGYTFVVDPGIGDFLYSGVIPTTNMEDALDLLTNTCDIMYQVKADTVYLKNK